MWNRGVFYKSNYKLHFWYKNLVPRFCDRQLEPVICNFFISISSIQIRHLQTTVSSLNPVPSLPLPPTRISGQTRLAGDMFVGDRVQWRDAPLQNGKLRSSRGQHFQRTVISTVQSLETADLDSQFSTSVQQRVGAMNGVQTCCGSLEGVILHTKQEVSSELEWSYF